MKKIAFVAYELNMGGTEVSLINLLSKIYNRYDITLYLFQKNGPFLSDVPKNIKIKEIFNRDDMKYISSIDFSQLRLLDKIKVIFVRILKKINLNLYFKLLDSKSIKYNEKYDWCVDYHGYGYYGSRYAIKYIDANYKGTFIHDEKINWIDGILATFLKYDTFFCVSNSCKNILREKYKISVNKIKICRNIIDIEKIKKLSLEKIDLPYESDKNILLTVGRLEHQKGYDMAIKIALKLIDNNIRFHWYIIGDGKLRNELDRLIEDNNLNKYITLLGLKKNPYPFIKNCDLYIQPSRHEGYGIAIAEARVLNKPIIATNLECIKEQIIDNYNGLLCNFDEDSFSDSIISLIDNKQLKNKILSNLKNNNDNDECDFVKIIGD